MCRRLASIEALDKAADRLAEVCEAVLYGKVTDPMATVVHVAFRGVETTPLDMAAQLGAIK